MTISKNPANRAGVATPRAAGELVCNRQKFSLGAAYKPAAFGIGDQIEIGVVPAGCKLVPHLSRISIPALDSNGSPTGDYALGTAVDPDALKGTAASETAVTLTAEDILLATADIGAQSVDVPIYAVGLAASATLPVVGAFVCDWVIRAFDPSVDVDVL